MQSSFNDVKATEDCILSFENCFLGSFDSCLFSAIDSIFCCYFHLPKDLQEHVNINELHLQKILALNLPESASSEFVAPKLCGSHLKLLCADSSRKG